MPRADLRGIRAGGFILTALQRAVPEMCRGQLTTEDTEDTGESKRGALTPRHSRAGAVAAEFFYALRYVSRGADMSPIDTASSCALVQSLLPSRWSSACSYPWIA